MKPFGWTLVVVGVHGSIAVALLQTLGKADVSWLVAFVWGTWLLSLAAIAFTEAQREDRKVGDQGPTDRLQAALAVGLEEIQKLRATNTAQQAEISRLLTAIGDLNGGAASAPHPVATAPTAPGPAKA